MSPMSNEKLAIALHRDDNMQKIRSDKQVQAQEQINASQF